MTSTLSDLAHVALAAGRLPRPAAPPRIIPPWTPWKTTDHAYLRQRYHADGAQACADHLGRSLAAVYRRARDLQLITYSEESRLYQTDLKRRKALGLVR